MIALATGARIDIQHISSGHSVEMVRLAKKMGANVWAEVTPHHFTLTEDAVLEHGTLAKMNPPLRTEWDRQMLIEGLKDGTIDMIATDHCTSQQRGKRKAHYRSTKRYYRSGNISGTWHYQPGKTGTSDFDGVNGKDELKSCKALQIRLWPLRRRGSS
mgnify:FL=1